MPLNFNPCSQTRVGLAWIIHGASSRAIERAEPLGYGRVAVSTHHTQEAPSCPIFSHPPAKWLLTPVSSPRTADWSGSHAPTSAWECPRASLGRSAIGGVDQHAMRC